MHSLVVYAATVVVFAAMAGLGGLPAALIDRLCSTPPLLRLPLRAMAGWGLVAVVSALLAIVDIDQNWLGRGFLLLGLVLLVPWRGARRSVQLQLLADLALIAVLMAPIGLLVAGTPAAAFDEFSHWLPNTRHLVETANYWVSSDVRGMSDRPGYPNASLVISLLTGQMIGPEIETPFKTFTLLLLGSNGAALAGIAAARWSADPSRGNAWTFTAALVAAGCLISLLDPFVDPRFAFTAMTDTATAFVLAIAVLTAAYAVDQARRGAATVASGWFIWAGMLSLTAVQIRETNAVLVAALDGACALPILLGRAGGPRLWARWVVALALPPAIGVVVWLAYKHHAGLGLDAYPEPIALWDWSAPLAVIKDVVTNRFAAQPVMGAGAVVLVLLAGASGAAAWRRSARLLDDAIPSPRVLLPITGIVVVSFVMLLAWAYTAQNRPDETTITTGLWRYLTELGPLILLTAWCSIIAPLRARRLSPRLAPVVLGVMLCGLVLSPVAGRAYFSTDCRFPDVAASRAAVAALRGALDTPGVDGTRPARVAVINPTMGDWMAYAMAFDLRWQPIQTVQWRTTEETLAEIEAWAWDQRIDRLLDFRPLDRAALRGKTVTPPLSLLGRPAAKGDPWPVIATSPPLPLPSCSIGLR